MPIDTGITAYATTTLFITDDAVVSYAFIPVFALFAYVIMRFFSLVLRVSSSR